MKKLTLLATASLLATGAFAQTAPTAMTIYGRVNDSIEMQKVNGASQTAMQDNSSRIGFKMSQAINADLSVGAQLEAGVNTTNGASTGGNLFARQATVNASGSWGKVRLGRLSSASDAYFTIVDAVSNHNHDTGTSSDQLSGYTTAGKFNNAIAYNGSTSGIGYGIAYGLKTSSNGNGTNSFATPLNLVASYDMGALSTGVAYEKYDQAKAFSVRANYTMGAFGFGGYIESDSGKKTDTLGVVTGENGRTILRLSGMYTVDKSEYHLNIGQAGSLKGTDNSGATQFTAGYNYNVDKSFKLYAFYTQVANNTNGTYSMNGIAIGATPAPAGYKSSSLAFGARYNF
jgi:predicted porin